jgi:hypothetical protein
MQYDRIEVDTHTVVSCRRFLMYVAADANKVEIHVEKCDSKGAWKE